MFGHAAGLKALSNIEPGWSAARTAVVLVDATVASSSAVQWAVQHWRREGDAVHIVHAVCCLLPKLEVYHSARWSHDPDATMLILPGSYTHPAPPIRLRSAKHGHHAVLHAWPRLEVYPGARRHATRFTVIV